MISHSPVLFSNVGRSRGVLGALSFAFIFRDGIEDRTIVKFDPIAQDVIFLDSLLERVADRRTPLMHSGTVR